MQRISAFLWIAAGGAVLQFVALGSNFYETLGEMGETKDAWFGVPHTADLILFSGIVAITGMALTAGNRQPARGRTVGLIVAGVGLLATLQLVYRMAVPPFGCLQFGCGFSAAQDVNLLAGIWIALAGCVAVTIGGALHAFSRTARETAPQSWIAERQDGMTPWLGLAVVGGVAMFVFPFTGFTLYSVTGFFGAEGGAQPWGGWLSIPHTSSLVLAMGAGILGLVVAAARRRSPLSPSALGATIGILAFVAGTRILYRLIADPFSTAGGAGNVQVGNVDVELAGYLGLAFAIVAVVAGFVHAAQTREAAVEPGSRTVTTG